MTYFGLWAQLLLASNSYHVEGPRGLQECQVVDSTDVFTRSGAVEPVSNQAGCQGTFT